MLLLLLLLIDAMIVGNIPTHLSQLRSLVALNLFNNELSGSHVRLIVHSMVLM